MYFVESLARDDKVKTKLEPLQWSRIKALLSRLYDTSNPAQSLGLYVERIMYWRNPPETFAWFTVSLIATFYCVKHPLAFMPKTVNKQRVNRCLFDYANRFTSHCGHISFGSQDSFSCSPSRSSTTALDFLGTLRRYSMYQTRWESCRMERNRCGEVPKCTLSCVS